MKPKYTFNRQKRYITRGIQETFSFELQLTLWNMIDDLIKEDIEVDYLQVFNIDVMDEHVTIKHTQEQPSYEKSQTFKTADIKDGTSFKVFVIDDLTHTTMLLASEY